MREFFKKYVGVRTEGMILAAAIWVLVGYGLVVRPPVLSVDDWLFSIGSSPILWMSTGGFAAGISFFQRHSQLGLVALFIAPFLRGISYFWSWVLDIVPGPPPGNPTGWFSAVLYLMMIAFVVLLSHIPATVRVSRTNGKR